MPPTSSCYVVRPKDKQIKGAEGQRDASLLAILAAKYAAHEDATLAQPVFVPLMQQTLS